MKRVGIIGCGSIFSVHAEAVTHLENAELVAVCDIESGRLSEKSAQYNAEAFTDYREMIKTSDLDVVHICTPHYLHGTMCAFALSNSVDVITEKPLTICFDEALHICKTASDYGRKLGIVFQNRFNPGSVLIKKHLENGNLGKIIGARCEVCWHRDDSYYQHDTWRGKYETEGGGVIINQAIHTLDLMRWMVGAEVLSVDAGISHRGETMVEVEDTAEGRIAFDGGVFGNFYFTTTNSYDAPAFVELHCENGFAKLSAARGTVTLTDGTVFEADETAECYCGKDCWGNSHFRQMKAFYEDEQGDYWKYSAEEALKTCKLVEEIYSSAGR